jgi:hypothetical protein
MGGCLRMNEDNGVWREFAKGRDVSVRGMEIKGVLCRGEDQRIFYQKVRSAIRRFGTFLIIRQRIISPFL